MKILIDALQQQLSSSIIGSKQTVKEKPQTFLEESQADVMKSWNFVYVMCYSIGKIKGFAFMHLRPSKAQY